VLFICFCEYDGEGDDNEDEFVAMLVTQYSKSASRSSVRIQLHKCNMYTNIYNVALLYAQMCMVWQSMVAFVLTNCMP
jgi:hypothetical protein